MSTGARVGAAVRATLAGVDPGRHLIAVVRKGTGELQELPASSDAFVWLRLCQVEMAGPIPAGRRQPPWWTSRRPVRPLTYHAAHHMFERGRTGKAGTGATLYSLRLIRHLVEPVRVTVLGTSEKVEVQIIWADGHRTGA